MGLDKHGYYSIYRGPEKTPKERISSGSYESIETGWQTLQQAINIQTKGGGLFTIYVSSKETDSSGYTTRYSAQIQMNGLPNTGESQHQVASPDQIGALVAAKVKESMDRFHLEKKIEDLENEIETVRKDKRKKGILGFFSDTAEMLEENPTMAQILAPVIHGIAARFLGNYAHGTVPAMNGVPGTTNISHEVGPLAEEHDWTEEEVAVILGCMDILSAHMEDPITVLKKLTVFVQTNPDQAKLILGNL